MHITRLGATACLFATLAMVGLDAAAATIRVNCEARGTRSKISVDAKALPAGQYSTQVVSGGNMATSPSQAAVRGEVEADYDSNAADIRAGASALTPGFITGGQVTGKVIDASGNTVIADTVSCLVRSR